VTPVRLRDLGRQPYVPVWQAMQCHAAERLAQAPDELWCVEHPPVYTQGRNGRPEHILDPGRTPVIAIDRGGQVTFHGPGQLVVYTLLDLPRRGIGVRRLVESLEQAIIDSLAGFGIAAERRENAPGVYVAGAKIAALGLRIRHGRSIHGLALNVDPRLDAFRRMNPCGYPGLATTSIRALAGPVAMERVRAVLTRELARQLSADGPAALRPVAELPPELVRTLALGRVPTAGAAKGSSPQAAIAGV